jgi:sugar phosphate isomerase/epimerase
MNEVSDDICPVDPPLSLGWLTIGTSAPFQLIEAAKAGGFSSIGISIVPRPAAVAQNLPSNSSDIVGNKKLVNEVRRSLKASGVSVLHMGGLWLDKDVPVSSYAPALETGVQLGATMAVVLAMPGLDQDLLNEKFGELCDQADSYGIRIAIEFAAYLGIRTIEEAADTIKKSGRANAGIVADVLHLYRSGGDADSLAKIPARQIYLAQLCDAPRESPGLSALPLEARTNRLHAGEGGLPLAEFVRALPSGTPIEIEAPDLAHLNMSHMAKAKHAGTAARAFFAGLQR